MSHEIVKRIRISQEQVFITCASNNVFPREYYKSEYPYLSAMLKDQGREVVEKEILKMYFEGCLKGYYDYDKYERAVCRVLAALQESVYDLWDKCRDDPEFENRLMQQFYESLKNPPKKQPCCLKRADGYMFKRLTTRNYLYSYTKCKTYHNPIEAEYALKQLGLDQRGFSVAPIEE